MNDVALVDWSLIGAQRGKTGVFFGVQFVKGSARIPAKAEVVGRVLRADYSAMPTHEAIEKGLLGGDNPAKPAPSGQEETAISNPTVPETDGGVQFADGSEPAPPAEEEKPKSKRRR